MGFMKYEFRFAETSTEFSVSSMKASLLSSCKDSRRRLRKHQEMKTKSTKLITDAKIPNEYESLIFHEFRLIKFLYKSSKMRAAWINKSQSVFTYPEIRKLLLKMLCSGIKIFSIMCLKYVVILYSYITQRIQHNDTVQPLILW